jgi:nucleotide-binding universal stress UspA family protein
MRCIVIAILLLIAHAEVASAQAGAAKPAASWILRWFQGAARTTATIPKTSPRVATSTFAQKSGTVAIPPKVAAPVEAAEKKPESVFSEAKAELRKHNAKETVKCVVKEKRLPDGVIIKFCAEKEKQKRY